MGILRRKFLKYVAGVFITTHFALTNVAAMFKNKLAPPSVSRNVAIIGSGVTGLCLGAMLSSKGYEVTVLERNSNFIGGHARSFRIEGIEFCAGPQFLWEFGKGDIGYRVLAYLKLEEKVAMLSLNQQVQNYYQYGSERGHLLPSGTGHLKDQILDYFPKESEGLSKFFEYFDSLFEASKHLEKNGLYMKDYSDIRSSILFNSSVSFGAKLDVWKLAKKTLQEVFDLCNLSVRAQNFLYCQGGVFAESANDLSIGVYVAAMGHIFSQSYVPKYGFKHMIDSLASVIKEGGGSIYTNKEVNKAIIKDGSVVQLETSDRKIYNCDFVISTISPRLTCNLITPCTKSDFKYSPSNSLTCVYIGVKSNNILLDKLEGRFNWWNAKDGNLNFSNPDMLKPPVHLYAGSQMAIKSRNTTSGKVIDLTIFAPGNFTQSKEAASKGTGHYQEFKESVLNSILVTVEKFLLPGLKENITFTSIKTPWDVYRELGVEEGNVYGRRLSPDSVLNAVKKINSVDNLTVANATVGLPGIATCFNTASLFFESITGEKI